MAIDISKSSWGSDLNDFIEANSISDTGWVTDGITMENGWATDTTGDPIEFRILTFGNSKLMFISGWIYVTQAVAANASVSVAQFPAQAKIGTTAFGTANTKSALGQFGITSDGVLNYTLHGSGTLAANDGIWLSVMILDQ
ncbi:hypothetical protein ABTQ33_13115 (plasmid) [Paucilactobacillus suebicus]|uniref:Uncharacterized protein n=1 Tax=Paucilactobacillus suebicus DSM 5007 = KCTC 3549 TaxID=1423807 RepID=A0A0R1VTZ2_9LACO|nr:hypothetical protein [Paucilactobacillus suebicus]KRM08909.1 hypothetical protein FD16_GL002216 [Paucilactobacillus suebicus DSM 5007 = KCTC 3549]